MSQIDQLRDVVEALNEAGLSARGIAHASFSGNDGYLCVMWGDFILWDSEGHHREHTDYGDDEGIELTLEVCLRSLIAYRDYVADVVTELHHQLAKSKASSQ